MNPVNWDGHYVKTETGREALRTRDAALSRAARNLLFAINGTQTMRAWLAAVLGATADDVQTLLDRGLIRLAADFELHATGPMGLTDFSADPTQPMPLEPVANAAASLPSPGASRASSAQAFDTTVVLPRTGSLAHDDAHPGAAPPADGIINDHAALYDYLTAHAKQHLGFRKGFVMTLAIERAQNLEALQAVALRYMEELRQTKGHAQAEQVLRELSQTPLR